MSQPQNNGLPDFSGPSKILFYNEGNPVALLVQNRAGHRKSDAKAFATAEIALGWCRKHDAMLVYLPQNLATN